MNIIEAMQDPAIFGEQFAGETWRNWRALLGGFYGLPDTDPDAFQSLTQRNPPISECDELWLVIGRRGGKSICAALLAVYEAVFNNHKEKLSAGEVASVMVIASDRKQARSVMRYIRGLLLDNPMLSRLVVQEKEESILLANRCAIEIMTASHRGTRGYSACCVICDEIAFWYSDGANPDSEILNAIRPSLATLGGKLIALSSPYARRGALWRNYHRYFGKDGRILVAQAPSLLMNPSLPEDVVTQAYEDDPLSAAAEYGAQFRSDVEGYCTLEVVERCTRSGMLEIPPSNGVRYSAFVDPSGGVSDAFTLAITHNDHDLTVVDVARSIKPPFNPSQVVAEYAQLLKQYRIHKVCGDNYAGEWPKEAFQKHGISYERSTKNRSEIYIDLLPLLNSERAELPPIPQLSNELIGLERRTSRSGRDIIDHAPGGHDDLCNAVAGAVVFSAQARKEIPNIKFTFSY